MNVQQLFLPAEKLHNVLFWQSFVDNPNSDQLHRKILQPNGMHPKMYPDHWRKTAQSTVDLRVQTKETFFGK
jgi:hypothetical protein